MDDDRLEIFAELSEHLAPPPSIIHFCNAVQLQFPLQSSSLLALVRAFLCRDSYISEMRTSPIRRSECSGHQLLIASLEMHHILSETLFLDSYIYHRLLIFQWLSSSSSLSLFCSRIDVRTSNEYVAKYIRTTPRSICTCPLFFCPPVGNVPLQTTFVAIT